MLPAQGKDELQKELSLQGGGADVTKYDDYLVPYTTQLQARFASLQKLKNKVSQKINIYDKNKRIINKK